MKNKNKIERLKSREWAEAAARLSGERDGSVASEKLSAMEMEIQKEWNDIKMTYKERDIDTDKAWMNVSKRIAADQENSHKRSLFELPLLIKIAASVIIVIGLGWAVFQIATPDQLTIATSSTEKNITVALPDGSTVWLNRNSSLAYPSRFSRHNRKVTLEGEAFFDVARDESKPFIIDAGKAEVKVLGTSFNVISDNGNNEVEVLVATGSVMVTSTTGEKFVKLLPGYIGRVSDKTNISEINSDINYLSWNTEKLIYNGQTLATVFSDLKRTYGIDINTNDDEIRNLTLTSVFEEQPQDTIIKVICTTFNLKYVKSDGKYLLVRK